MSADILNARSITIRARVLQQIQDYTGFVKKCRLDGKQYDQTNGNIPSQCFISHAISHTQSGVLRKRESKTVLLK